MKSHEIPWNPMKSLQDAMVSPTKALPGGARLVARGARLHATPFEALVAGAQGTGECATWWSLVGECIRGW